MRKSEVISGLCFAAVGLVFLVGAVQLGIGSRTSDGVPGAGFFPFLVSILVLILSGVLIVKTLCSTNSRSPFATDAEQLGNRRTMVITVVGLAILLLLWLFPPLNLLDRLELSETFLFRDHAFEAAAIVFSLFMNRMLGRSWLFSVLFALAFFILINGVFTRFLYIQFDI